MGPVIPLCRTWNVSINVVQFVVSVVLHACHWSTIPSVSVHRMDITAWSVVVNSFLHKKETNSGRYKWALCWQWNWHTYHIIECSKCCLSYHFLFSRPIKLRKPNHTSVVGFPKPFLIAATVNFHWHSLDLESSSVGMPRWDHLQECDRGHGGPYYNQAVGIPGEVGEFQTGSTSGKLWTLAQYKMSSEDVIF